MQQTCSYHRVKLTIDAHFANVVGIIQHLPIDLPEFSGTHTDERTSFTVIETLDILVVTPNE
jgi:hypothetical protein